jgi:hypothetical protein
MSQSKSEENRKPVDEIDFNGWGLDQPKNIQEQLRTKGWRAVESLVTGIATEWAKLNRAMARKMKNSEIEDDFGDRLDVNAMPKHTRKYIASLGELLASRTIKFGVDYRWLPDAETCGPTEGERAVPIPPHLTFDIDVGIPDAEMEWLLPNWTKCISEAMSKAASEKSKSFNISGFTQGIHAMRVMTLLSCLPRLMKEDPQLREELANGTELTTKTAKLLVANPRGTALWKHMHEIHKLPAFVAMFYLVCQIRTLPDYTGKHRRKIVITAFLPFNVAVIRTYLMWLLDQKAMGTEIGLAFTALDDFDEDVAFLNTQTAEKLEVINRFKGVGNVEYTDKPACLVASAPQIGTGTDLVPAADMVSMDMDWIIQTIIQVSGRIRRAEMSQKAAVTTLYRIMCYSDIIRLQRWMNDRILNNNTVREELAKCGVDIDQIKEVFDRVQALHENDDDEDVI